MSFWFDYNNNCTYDEWVRRSGDLVMLLDDFCKTHIIDTVLEFGSGNSTRVLSKRCNHVVTMDSNIDSVIVPTKEQKSFNLELCPDIKREDNVIFLCEDILRFDFSTLMISTRRNPDLIVFDLGSSEEEKYLNQVCYDRMKANNLINVKTIFIVDDCHLVSINNFLLYLRNKDKYRIQKNNTNQLIAWKGNINAVR